MIVNQIYCGISWWQYLVTWWYLSNFILYYPVFKIYSSQNVYDIYGQIVDRTSQILGKSLRTGLVTKLRCPLYWDGPLNWDKGCFSNIAFLLRMLWVVVCFHSRRLTICKHYCVSIFHGRFAQRLAVNKPCLQIVRHLLWKQTTTHSIRNNNAMFEQQPLSQFKGPSQYI